MTDTEINNVAFGSSNRMRYDNCSYQKRLYESVSPLSYYLYDGAYINNNHCQEKTYGFWKPYDLVDYESELLNITRPNSQCDQFKYSGTCQKSSSCVNTFDKSVPVVIPATLCPIVHNNLKKTLDSGIAMPQRLNINDNRVDVDVDVNSENNN